MLRQLRSELDTRGAMFVRGLARHLTATGAGVRIELESGESIAAKQFVCGDRFTLADVTKLLQPAPCGSVQRLIEERLADRADGPGSPGQVVAVSSK